MEKRKGERVSRSEFQDHFRRGGFIGADLMSFRGWFPEVMSFLWRHLIGFVACPPKRSSYFDGPLVDCTFFEGLQRDPTATKDLDNTTAIADALVDFPVAVEDLGNATGGRNRDLTTEF
ncbi:hypothetical protein TIFTF001_023784 [Ficus carica]|uniref:Uncharacterized protein n=1 Tax=Ficus carica TaxID=3494 RepID=A0AA88AK85_FICCA|nr:hypothetical protein TIFTF001_023784 [Ficus carica]